MRGREGPPGHDLRPLWTAYMPSHGPDHRRNRNAHLQGLGSRGRADAGRDTRSPGDLMRRLSPEGSMGTADQPEEIPGTREIPEAAAQNPLAWEMVGPGRYMPRRIRGSVRGGKVG